MDGIFGWLGDHAAHQELIKCMGRATRVSSEDLPHGHSNSMFGIAGCSRLGKATTHVEANLVAALHGRPMFHDDALSAIARDRGPAAAAASGWTRFGAKLPTLLSGNFALVVIEPLRRRAFLAIDRMGVERLCYACRNGQLVFGTSARSVAAHPASGRSVDLQAIYDYLYFHADPESPDAVSGHRKAAAGPVSDVGQ